MKIISYNVNGLRAAINKDIKKWLEEEQPDVLCIQETKLQPDQLPADVFESMGYHVYLHSAQRKGYSGVALITRIKPDQIVYGIGEERYDIEGRFLRADFGDLSVVSIYHPNGTSGEERLTYKMEWLDYFHKEMNTLRKTRPNLVLCGDYNIAHQEIDIHDPVRNAKYSGFLPMEREWFTQFLADGYIDSFRYKHPSEQVYSWWSYRFKARERNKGWRIDYCITTIPLASHIKRASILTNVVHSDHCPILLELE